MLGKAEVWGYRSENSNSSRPVRRNRARRFGRYLSVEELARLGFVPAEERAGNGAKASGATAIALLVLRGCRVAEVLNLQWQDIKRAAEAP